MIKHTLWCVITASVSILSSSAVYGQTIVHQVPAHAGQTWCDASIIDGIFNTLNAFRVSKGVPALTLDPLGMEDADLRAIQFSQYMQTNPPGSAGFNPHTGYDTTAASIGYHLIGENLAYETTDPNYVIYVDWQDTLHLDAMLATDANITGISCIYLGGVAYMTYEPGCSPSFCGKSSPVSTPPPTPTPTPTGTPTLDSEESAFVSLLNAYRAQNGAGPLKVSIALENAAQWMSTDMATNNIASHTDSLGRSPATRLAAFNYPYSPWGEDIAGGYSDAQDTLNQWETACDPNPAGTCTYAHRQILLSTNFLVMGIGRAYSATSAYGWYWTADFGGVADAILGSAPPTPDPTISSFKASPSVIAPGQQVTLSWSVTSATTVTLNNGIGTVSTVTSKVVSPSKTTTYTLTASNSTGSVTANVTVTVSAARDTQPPTTPTLTSARAESATEIALTWSASSDNVGVVGYQITRSGSVLTSVSGTTLSYTDTSVHAATTYSYSIKAYDAAGNYSGASNAIQVTTPAAVNAPPPNANGTPELISLTPNAGSGASKVFSFEIADAKGFADIQAVSIDIAATLTPTGACWMIYWGSSHQVSLANDTGTGWVGTETLGSSGTLQNSQCTLNLAGSSFSGSGVNLTVNLSLTFPAGFAGSKEIWETAESNEDLYSGWGQAGAWTVP
ncbi:MAG: CAP domain-containing protein [Bryobacteraceae bacterium]